MGVIGCGHWGPNHIRNFARNPRARVVACADVSTARLDSVTAIYPDLRATTDTAAVLAAPDVDAVVVATPTATHAALVTEALRHDKHVLVEKPIARTAREARRLAALAEAQGRILMVGHVFLYNGGIQALRKHVRKDCGALRYVHATRTNLGPFRDDVNVVWDLASHDVSIFSYLLEEEPVEVSARGGCYLREDNADVAFITLQYPSGIVGNIHASWLHPRKVRTITAVGDQRMVTWDDLEPDEPVRIYNKRVDREPYWTDFGDFQLRAREGSIVSPRVELREPLAVQADAFLKACRTRQAPLANATHGVRVVEVLEAVQRSMDGGGAPKRVRRAT